MKCTNLWSKSPTLTWAPGKCDASCKERTPMWQEQEGAWPHSVGDERWKVIILPILTTSLIHLSLPFYSRVKWGIVVSIGSLIIFHLSKPGHNKNPVHLPGASEFLCAASRSPCQLACWASKVEPETLKMYTFSDFTRQQFELIRRWFAFVIHSKGETAHRRKKSG